MTFVINLGLALLGGPLLAGVVRKMVKARVHSRQGPPIIQPFYDLFKLLGKEDLESSPSLVLRYAPMVALAAILAAALLTPMGLPPPLGGYGDMIVFAYFITIAAVMIVIAGVVSASPYSMIGAGREIMMHLAVEPVLIICLVIAAIKSGSLLMWDMVWWNYVNGLSINTPSMIIGGVALLLALQAQVGKIPFDIVEAETEIMGGPLIELSGPKLALFEWAFFARQIVYASVLVAIFIPWGTGFALPWNIAAHLLKITVVILLVGLIDVVNPRLRIDQAMAYFFGVVFVALVGMAFALIGA